MIGSSLAAPLLFSSGVTWALAFTLRLTWSRTTRSAQSTYHRNPPILATTDASKRKFWREMADGARMLVRNRVIFGILVCAWSARSDLRAEYPRRLFVTGNLHLAAKTFVDWRLLWACNASSARLSRRA